MAKRLPRSRVYCQRTGCRKYRLVASGKAHSALQLCAEHLKERELRLQRKYNEERKEEVAAKAEEDAIKRERRARIASGLRVVSRLQEWPFGGILSYPEVRDTLDDGFFPDAIKFQDVQTGDVLAVARRKRGKGRNGLKPQKLVPVRNDERI